MERRSHYQRGHNGHPHTANPYLIAQQKKSFKNYRNYRFAASGFLVGVLMLLAPYAEFGENAVLTLDGEVHETNLETINPVDIDVEATRKSLLSSLQNYEKACGDSLCAEAINTLTNSVLNAALPEEFIGLSQSVSELGLTLTLQSLYKITHPTF